MGLESVTFISDLVVTNPVGATDPKSQGDDHIRNLKTAIKNTFPSITGAVTLSHTQINDAAQKSAANVFTNQPQTVSVAGDVNGWVVTNTAASVSSFFGSGGASGRIGTSTNHGFDFYTNNVLRGSISNAGAWTLNGVAATDFARLSQSNVFTGVSQIAQVNDAGTTVYAEWVACTTSATARLRLAYTNNPTAAGWGGFGGTSPAAIFATDSAPIVIEPSYGSGSLILQATGGITLNGVNATDFARLSQSNTFTNAAQGISATNGAWSITDTGTTVAFTSTYVGAISNAAFSLRTNNTARLTVSAAGDFDFKGGLVTTNNASAGEVGPVGAIGRNISASSNTAASDAGRSVQFTGGSSQTFTLDGDPPIDSVVVLINRSGSNWSIAASGTLTFGGVTGTRTMATGSMASAFHLGSGNWYISGGSLT